MSTTRKTLVTLLAVVALGFGLAGCAVPGAGTINAGQATSSSSSSAPSSAPSSAAPSLEDADVANTEQVASPAAVTSVEDWALAVAKMVDLYRATGQSMSTSELTGLTYAANEVTRTVKIATNYIETFSAPQRAALLTMANAGSSMMTAMGALAPDSTITRYWDIFETGFAAFEAAS